MTNNQQKNIIEHSLTFHFKETIRLAIPVSVGQLGHILLGVVDSFMVGRLGAESLAASALANGIFFLIMVLGIGMSHAVTALVSIERGKNNFEECGVIVRQALLVNVVFGIILTFLTYYSAQLIKFMNQAPEVTILTKSYLEILSLSIIPFMVFQTYRQFVEGLSFTKPPMYVAIFSNVVNAFVNWLLIFGNLGFPALGLDGAGFATLMTRIFMGITMMLIVLKIKRYSEYDPSFRFKSINYKVIKELIRIGLPSGLIYSLEVGAFAFAAIIIGWLGSLELAAHQIAINLASISYMVVLGISAASTIRVGNAFGKRSKIELKRASEAALLLGIGFMFCTGVFFIIFNKVLPSFYISDPLVIEIASSLLIVAALFQLSDGTQAVGMGLLKGITEVNVPMFITFISYWIIALPVGYFLAFEMNLGVIGLWYGLLIGLTLAGVSFVLRFFYRVKTINFEDKNLISSSK